MIEKVAINEGLKLADYEAIAHLSEAVRALRAEAKDLVSRLKGRTVWMVNSTARGGGVAEMLPQMVTIFRELGVNMEWVVIGSSEPRFFRLTKQLHNLIHGSSTPQLTGDDRALYDAVSRENADSFRAHLRAGDLLVVHDPQPLGMGALLRQEVDVRAVFRCHIGLDEVTTHTRSAWDFLKTYAEFYDHSIFTTTEYIPDFLKGSAGVIRPAIDPLGHKNRDLRLTRLMGVLCNSSLVSEQQSIVPLDYTHTVMRLDANRQFVSIKPSSGIGIPFRPIVTQISRWDRLKGFKPLLDGFVQLKKHVENNNSNKDDEHLRRLQLVRLVLAGPEPAAVADDPEATEVLDELITKYVELPKVLQEEIAIVSLPMTVKKENELIVNALQRSSTVIVQNSLREGFGLTVTEAMWKRAAVLGSSACGIRQQIRDGVDGWLIQNPEDPDEISTKLNEILKNSSGRVKAGQTAQRRVRDEFLVFSQVSSWLKTLVERVSNWTT